MTLIELLVVIIIITTLVAAAIPLLSPSNDDRRIREATRGLNTYISGAISRAVALRRPYGIYLKRLSQDTNTDPNRDSDPSKDLSPDNGACLEVFYVEQQPPYAGFDSNSRACVTIDPTPPSDVPNAVLIRFITSTPGSTDTNLPVGWSADQFPSQMIRPGDVIEINGTQYELLYSPAYSLTNIKVDGPTGPASKDPFTVYFDRNSLSQPPQILARPLNDSGQQIIPRYDDQGKEIGSVSPLRRPYWTNASPYKILRQATLATDEPYQLPEGTAIDLRASGVGGDDFFQVPNVHDNHRPVMIVFTPEGRVQRVSFNLLPHDSLEGDVEVFDQAVVDNVYLLVGRRDRIAPPDVASDPTLRTGIPTAVDQVAKIKEPINWLSGDSRWIVIGSQTGRVVTIENAFVDLAALINQYTASPFLYSQSTEAMRNAQIVSAREFTREMKQLGGR
ncbi:MAG TPA: hypothetical protein VHU84_11890 [Lacipirellulaceae bacterium]|jgi:type II secretory pathway pseudopilin PulG|nr:hypothetical protein [Lacipirellulaceae bacterium]